MADELANAIGYLMGKIEAVAEIKQAPQYLPEMVSNTPFCIAYPENGQIIKQSSSTSKIIHTIAVELHLGTVLLPQAVALAISLADDISAIFLDDDNITLGENATTILLDDNTGGIRYTFGRLEWAGQEHIGFKWLVPIKIRST